MEFRADGTLVEYAIGRGDAPEARPAGRWDTTGELLRGSSAGSGRIVAATPDRLEIAWQG
ncbi:hypothetical protein EV651_101197 [Kribbella sp. VKM Ac-2571]|uniref:hypothetical protein n=1 Tax=Kribbella sp. VKM Ac-2571 TaxID=2512222 RepID=UPI001060DAA9|nr:hypothetical protein [Kribbella sp. VKM Ac-2571]TDO69158.1 hypothetical protein EV651_101197 [Kribbella sp. VKM Ac-2571]